MLGMSQEQVLGLVRQILPVLGGIAVALGWLTTNQVASLTATVLQIAGPAMIIGSTVWSLINKTKANLVSTVANMPEVKSVTLDPTKEGVSDLNLTTPTNVKIAQ